MTDNSDKRKRTLIVSVLAFLLTGGGVFLFFVVQGSNDLTGKGKKGSFSYGSAAREGVSSFFKTVGFMPDDEEILAKQKESRMAARGFLPDGELAAADLSNWMAKDPSPASASASASASVPAKPTYVPKMSGGASSGLGGGGASAKSAGSVSRFGSESDQRTTSVSKAGQASASGTTDKGTLGTLKNAKALLGDGLRSNSAMTAQSKWGQSFGVGGAGAAGKSGDLAYNKTGLVNLDKIKSGEIASLKPGAAPEAGAFDRDKEAEKKDPGLQAAAKEASEKSKKDQEKKEMAKALTDAAGGALSQSGGDDKSAPGEDPGQAPITDEEREEAKNLSFTQPTSLGDGTVAQDRTVDITRTPDGGVKYEINGQMTTPEGETIPYTDVVKRSRDGKLTFE
jgi:hypothetical protein